MRNLVRTLFEEQLVRLVLMAFAVVVLIFSIRSEWIYPIVIGALLPVALVVRAALRRRADA